MAASNPRTPLVSRIAYSTTDRIVVRGHDLADELMGHRTLGEIAFLELAGRLPEPNEARMLDAMLVALVEHGSTPSTLAARMTVLGEPDALQASVAAGLLGIGSRFLGTVGDVARMLQQALAAHPDASPDEVADHIVADHRERGAHVPGLGHPVHTAGDPRTERLFAIAEQEGVDGRHVELVRRVADRVTGTSGHALPINVTAAVGAIASDLGLDWRICRGIALVARTIGLIGHIAEELDDPIAPEIWRRVENESNTSREDT